jgi:hypothetical protein
MITTVYACSSPIVYNEFGVPVSLYGTGHVFINGSKYSPSQSLIYYNFSVKNTNQDEDFTLIFTPSTDLLNYAYGTSKTIPADSTDQMGMFVYIDGVDKIGNVYVTGYCSDSIPVPEGVFSLHIDGRGTSIPGSCDNTLTSCGIWPDCVDMSTWDGCYNGYKRDYYCANNLPQYSESCTAYCCNQFSGGDGYCNDGICIDPTPQCDNECSFDDLQCIEGDVYSCVLQTDGCYDLVLDEECGDNSCFNSQCVDESLKIGNIAYLCRDTDCLDGIEPDLLSWLENNNWLVTGKAYDEWNLNDFDNYDMIMCSDELQACKIGLDTDVYESHKTYKKPFIEISDYREAHSAYSFDYVSNPYGYLGTGKSLYVTTDEVITEVFQTEIPIFFRNVKIGVLPDYKLEDSVIDVADVNSDNRKSAFFKLYENGNHGRYVYLGWFYRESINGLTIEGQELLNRTLIWSYCGDACLSDPNQNKPPVAIPVLIPNPVGYVGQVIKFDGSESYDPEGESLTYYWDFGDGSNSGWITENITTHVYDEQGEYTVTLTVNDGELDSEPSVKTLTILPQIQNKVAFICGDSSCSDDSEQEIISYLEDNGYSVTGKTQYYWTSEELIDYDFMLCTDAAGGCAIKSWSDVYDKHVNGNIGFLEIPDYSYVRAGYSFGYVSSLVGYSVEDSSIEFLEDCPITNGLSEDIYNDETIIGGIFRSRLKDPSENLARTNDKDLSTLFKITPFDSRGRYAYVGWFYRSSISDLTEDGEELLLRTIKWVQCGSVEECE